jgi:predicted ATPase
VQDAAYGTLLREPRRALHARIAEALEREFTDIAESQPELVARHCAEAGLTEKAASLWGKAGHRSLARSALAEAVAQLTRALDQITLLPPTLALRRERIKLEVALINPLSHVKGFASPESKAAVERARLSIEKAKTLGQPPEDPLLLFSVLWAALAANYVAFNGDILRDIGAQFLALAEKEETTAPVLIAHRSMATLLLCAGDVVQSRPHYDQAIALYDPTQHRSLATRFEQDARVATLSYRSIALWTLGHPEAALGGSYQAVFDAREVDHAATSMYALTVTSLSHILCADYAKANMQLDEAVALADEKGALFWKATATVLQGCVLALTGKPSDAVQMISDGTAAFRSTGATLWMPLYLSYLARVHADLGRFDDAWRCIGEAATLAETTKERWCEADIHRIAGEIALMSPERDTVLAEARFERARSRSHVSSKQSPGSYAPRSAWRGCGAIRANDGRRTIF